MRPYLAGLAFVTLCGVAPHAVLQQQAAPAPSTPQPPAKPPAQPGQESQPAPPQQPPQPAAPQPPSQPAAPQPPAQIGRVFGSDAGTIFNPVKPDRTMDFEMV